MRENLLTELENEYAIQRKKNEQEEYRRREHIRGDYPDIEKVILERENIVFGTIRKILDGKGDNEYLPGKMTELNGKIDALLAKNGLPTDYLSPVYRCPFCKDTGYAGENLREPCECLKRAYMQKIRNLIGLDRNQTETFETYDENLIPDEPVNGTGITQRRLTGIAKEQCERWAESYPETEQRDILLTGGSGLGKTFMLRAMAAKLIERGHSVLIVSSYTFLQLARKSFFDSDDGIRDLLETPVLMLDDLGSEPLLQNITVEQLFQLINERQSSNLSTIISTNLTLQELRERYTERIASRLNNPKNCLVLTLAGRDLRKIER